MNRFIGLAAIVVALGFLLLNSIFVLDVRHSALVLRFNQVRQEVTEPGLHFKLPWPDRVVRYDARIQALDTPEQEITPSDDRLLLVDAFARYRIIDVRQFREALPSPVDGRIQPSGESRRLLEGQLNGILNDEMRAVLGADGVTSNTILSTERAALMARIQANADIKARELGIEFVDVRLKQTNLPVQNEEATYRRMIAEREREATDERARGQEAARRVRAQADRTVTELVSAAQRDAEIIRGEADAERNRIFAEAFGQDPEFFEFYRSLTAYERALRQSDARDDNGNLVDPNLGDTFLVLDPNSAFFDVFRTDPLEGRSASPASSAASEDGEAQPDAPTQDEPTDEADSADVGAPDAPLNDGDASDASTADDLVTP